MNPAHLHLVVNHIPVFTTLIGTCILVWGMYKKSTAIRNIAFTLFIVGAVGAYVAVESGESAEEIVEELKIISNEKIHDHEEAAELALWFALATGVLSIMALAAEKLKLRFENSLHILILVSAFSTLGMLMYAANQGGKIRHPEAYSQQIELQKEYDDD